MSVLKNIQRSTLKSCKMENPSIDTCKCIHHSGIQQQRLDRHLLFMFHLFYHDQNH